MGQSTLIILKNFAKIKRRHDNIKNLKFIITNFLPKVFHGKKIRNNLRASRWNINTLFVIFSYK